jgi:hypothetical protein
MKARFMFGNGYFPTVSNRSALLLEVHTRIYLR